MQTVQVILLGTILRHTIQPQPPSILKNHKELYKHKGLILLIPSLIHLSKAWELLGKVSGVGAQTESSASVRQQWGRQTDRQNNQRNQANRSVKETGSRRAHKAGAPWRRRPQQNLA